MKNVMHKLEINDCLNSPPAFFPPKHKGAKAFLKSHYHFFYGTDSFFYMAETGFKTLMSGEIERKL